ncbi:MAG TPA: hypothetical protein ENN81_09620 [Phycisphaerales bacterium]|nr:hypothetical protein [Phycisphaerales bacterium]
MKRTTRHPDHHGLTPDGWEPSNDCKAARGRVRKLLDRWLGADALWVQRHIAVCPRCRWRFAALAKVDVALSLLKSEPHAVDLLARANSAAVGVLRHDLRECEQACQLKVRRPVPTLWERAGNYSHSVANLAACIVLLALMKVGVITSMRDFSAKGQDAIEQYYAAQVGRDVADEIFTA